MGATTSILSPSVSFTDWRAGAGTNCPFTAVAIFLPPYPSAFSASASVSGSMSLRSPFTNTRIGRPLDLVEHCIGDTRGHRRCKQKAVTKKAVHEMRARADPPHGWQVGGEGRPQAGVDLEDLRLGKRRMQRACRPQHLQGGAHAHAGVRFAFDHGGADHEDATTARDRKSTRLNSSHLGI